MLDRAKAFYAQHESRRTVRDFSDRAVDKEVIELIIKTASTAPSGANKQPWNFGVISSPEIKTKIRDAAEKEEFDTTSPKTERRRRTTT